MIDTLAPNQAFVFGSNSTGEHDIKNAVAKVHRTRRNDFRASSEARRKADLPPGIKYLAEA